MIDQEKYQALLKLIKSGMPKNEALRILSAA